MEKGVKYTIRDARKGDEVDAARIVSECFWPATPRQIEGWWRREKRKSKGDAKNFVAVVNGKIVSMVAVEFKELHLGDGVYVKTAGIAGVCTDSDYRRKGIITNLMRSGLEYAKQIGASNSALYTGFCIPAHRIYSRFGFLDVETWPLYVKYLDFACIFSVWLRERNKLLKHSKLAAKALKRWNKAVVLEIEGYGMFAFKCRDGRFQRLKKPPKKPDVRLDTDIKTLQSIKTNYGAWGSAVSSRKLKIRCGNNPDVLMVRRILQWMWDE